VDVPHAAEVAYSPRGEQAVVRFELPSVDVIPGVESYTYVEKTATLREKKRPAAQIAQLYRSVISQITLLYMRNIFVVAGTVVVAAGAGEHTPSW
jgi:restriction system protein